MKIDIMHVQNMLSSQNYLEFDNLLTKMYIEEKNGVEIYILKDGETLKILKSFDDIEEFKKRMVQIYGIFAFI